MFVQLKHQSASDLVEGGKLVQWTKRMDESRGAIEVMDLKRQKKKNGDRKISGIKATPIG